MSLRINTNVAALNAYNNLNMNQAKLSDAFTQLSSGLRINKAADDAAGLSISQGLTSQINGMTQAVSNAQDGINVAQIADGALGTVQNVLQRMRTLAVQASNTGSQSAASTAAAQSEITTLNTQLDNISSQTAFGGTKLLDGTYAGTFQVGANAGETIGMSLTARRTRPPWVSTRVNVTTGAARRRPSRASTPPSPRSRPPGRPSVRRRTSSTTRSRTCRPRSPTSPRPART